MTDLPEGWTSLTLGEVGEWIGGGTPSKSNSTYWTNGSIPWVSPKDMKRLRIDDAEDHITDAAVAGSSVKLVPKGAVMIVTRSGILAHSVPVAIAEANLTVNQDLKAIAPSRAVDSEYLLLSLRALEDHFLSECRKHGTTVSSLDTERLKKTDLSLPPLPEQRRIVAKLDRLSARSAAARDHLARTTKLATRAKQAILSAALSGELTRSWRDADAGDGWTDGQIDEIEAHRADYAKSRRGSRLESDSGLSLGDLGALPDSWFPCHLAEIANIQVGHAFRSAWFTADGPLLVRGANVAPGALSWEDTKRLDPDRAPEFRKFRLDEGDIVLAMDRPLISTGLKIARVDAASAGSLLVQRVARITGRSQADQSYLWYVLNSRIFIRHAIERATGGDLPHISGNDILTTPVPLPPLDEQREIVRRIEFAFARIDWMTEEASRAAYLLDRLDERLLAKAFRGELVPQDPEDEPAEALLARIREARAAAPKPKRGRRALA